MNESNNQKKNKLDLDIDFGAFDKVDPKAKPNKRRKDVIARKIKIAQSQEKKELENR